VAKVEPGDIRNIVLVGHGGSGKTMLAEAMLLKGGIVKRLGSVDDGTTVSDQEPEEKERQYSLATSVMHCPFEKKHFNIIDTPGAADFVGGLVSGLAGADLAVICVNAMKGVEVMTRKAWDYAGSLGLARMIAITRMDGDNVNYQEVLSGIQQVFGKACVPFTIPQGEGEAFSGVTRVMADDAEGEGVDELKLQITENAVESDEALMEKYLEEGEVSPAEVLDVMHSAILTGTIVPVFALASEKDHGVEELMEGIAGWGPGPFDVARPVVRGEESTTWTPSADDPFCAVVFKGVADPHVGKVSYFRVLSGSLAEKSSAQVSSTESSAKFAQLFVNQGEKREEVSEATAGMICSVTKVEDLQIGDTIHESKCDIRFPPLPFPTPMTGLAITPKSRGDEQKMSTNIQRLCEEDPTFVYERNELTSEQVIRGMGQLHLEVVLSRLHRRYGLEVNTKPPKVPYLETITKEAEGRYRHKKQTGGAGQFGEVWIRVRPNERGGGFEFVNSIVGGAISQPFIPSVEKGVRGAMEKGPVAGYPMVDVVVELYDGKEHPVDSKDIAFQLAGRYGFLETVAKCGPVMLEPIVNMEIVFPGQYFGDISGDISSRRGRPTGTDQLGDMQVLKAQVPLAEVMDYGSTVNSITQGEGFYTMEMSHYEAVPGNIAQQVAARAKADQDEEE
jgi:elongation factor G